MDAAKGENVSEVVQRKLALPSTDSLPRLLFPPGGGEQCISSFSSRGLARYFSKMSHQQHWLALGSFPCAALTHREKLIRNSTLPWSREWSLQNRSQVFLSPSFWMPQPQATRLQRASVHPVGSIRWKNPQALLQLLVIITFAWTQPALSNLLNGSPRYDEGPA